MIAKITVSSEYDLASISEAAGQTNPERRIYVGGELHVSEIEQSALDAALASYDHAAIVTARAEAKAAKKRDKSVLKMFDQLLTELDLPQDALDRILDKGK